MFPNLSRLYANPVINLVNINVSHQPVCCCPETRWSRSPRTLALAPAPQVSWRSSESSCCNLVWEKHGLMLKTSPTCWPKKNKNSCSGKCGISSMVGYDLLWRIKKFFCLRSATEALRSRTFMWVRSVLPYVIDPAVHAYRHEHVEVDPQRKPVLGFLVAQPMNQSGLVYFGFQAVPQDPWYWTQNIKRTAKW